MEQVYAVGISVIQFLQNWCAGWDWYFELVNHATNPHYAFHMLLPLVAAVDSVFAAQFLLCVGFGTWLNAVMKWWLLEDRPYWWVRETSYYSEGDRPRLVQTAQTCETGPGCPSGHSNMVSMELLLVIIWISHVVNDRKWSSRWWKPLAYPAYATFLLSTMVARMYVAAHFPHQCLLGALIGTFLAPALCIYISDPFIWPAKVTVEKTRTHIMYHTIIVLMLMAIGVITYWTLKLCGVDPQWSVRLAFRWCENPDSIRVDSTPLFALVQSTGSLLGWALSVSPSINKYRHYTGQRSLILAAFATYLAVQGVYRLQDLVPTSDVKVYYLYHFLIYAMKVPLLLRAVPFVAMWPFVQDRINIKKWRAFKLKTS